MTKDLLRKVLCAEETKTFVTDKVEVDGFLEAYWPDADDIAVRNATVKWSLDIIERDWGLASLGVQILGVSAEIDVTNWDETTSRDVSLFSGEKTWDLSQYEVKTKIEYADYDKHGEALLPIRIEIDETRKKITVIFFADLI